jgi:hypothetical protein
VNLRFERLVVLAFDLKLGLKLFHLEIESRDFGAKLREVGADLPLLLRRLVSWMLIRIREAWVSGLRELLRIRGSRRLHRRWLKSLCRLIRENWRRREGVRQRARPRVLSWLNASVG